MPNVKGEFGLDAGADGHDFAFIDQNKRKIDPFERREQRASGDSGLHRCRSL